MAVTYAKYDDIVENMVAQCDSFTALGDLIPILQAYRIANAVPLAFDMTQDDKNDMLKILTGCVVATETDLNCYPTGLATTTCFDEDGDPV